MTEEQLYRIAYNAHEGAECAAMKAMLEHLRRTSLEALMCLADPSWCWDTRGWMSPALVDLASEVLDEKLEALIAA